MFYLSKKKKVPEHLDEERDFVLACLRTCEGNLWEFVGNYTLLYHTGRLSGWRCHRGCLKSLIYFDATFLTFLAEKSCLGSVLRNSQF